MGDPVFPPSGHLSWSELNGRHRSAVPSVGLCSDGFLQDEHLALSSVFLTFIDFNYHTTWPRNPSQLFLLVLNLRKPV